MELQLLAQVAAVAVVFPAPLVQVVQAAVARQDLTATATVKPEQLTQAVAVAVAQM
jgi:hypothetical protein